MGSKIVLSLVVFVESSGREASAAMAALFPFVMAALIDFKSWGRKIILE